VRVLRIGYRHDFVEVYSSEHSDTRMIPDGTDFVVAFVVDDIREAIGRLQAAGLEIVSEPVWAAEGSGRSQEISPRRGYLIPAFAAAPIARPPKGADAGVWRPDLLGSADCPVLALLHKGSPSARSPRHGVGSRSDCIHLWPRRSANH
jgi:hypothetical protein